MKHSKQVLCCWNLENMFFTNNLNKNKRRKQSNQVYNQKTIKVVLLSPTTHWEISVHVIMWDKIKNETKITRVT